MRRSTWAFFLAIVSAGCDGSVAPATDGASCGAAAVAAVSEPCCPAYGPDACGAGLFCAAFDGRTVPTCYLEHSRADRSECSADVQCVSGSCHAGLGRCRSGIGACDRAIGCADGVAGPRACAIGTLGTWECTFLTDGAPASACITSADCRVGACDEATGRCLGPCGASDCTDPAACATVTCACPRGTTTTQGCVEDLTLGCRRCATTDDCASVCGP